MVTDREFLCGLGVDVQEDWVVQSMAVDSDLVMRPTEPDVYGNTYETPVVVGKKVTVVLYRAEN